MAIPDLDSLILEFNTFFDSLVEAYESAPPIVDPNGIPMLPIDFPAGFEILGQVLSILEFILDGGGIAPFSVGGGEVMSLSSINEEIAPMSSSVGEALPIPSEGTLKLVEKPESPSSPGAIGEFHVEMSPVPFIYFYTGSGWVRFEASTW